MRNTIDLALTLGLVLLALGSTATSANAQEAPAIRVQANAPGWITVNWEHTGDGVFSFLIQRQDAPYNDNSIRTVAESLNRTDGYTDKNLAASTLYNFRVCAIYAYSRSCTDWVGVRTLATPSGPGPGPGPGGGAPWTLVAPELGAARDPDPKKILLDWSGDPGWVRYTVRSGNAQIEQNNYDSRPWYLHPNLKQIVVSGKLPSARDWVSLYDTKTAESPSLYGGLIAILSYNFTVRPNTTLNYRVCFTSAANETKCSSVINVTPTPVAPTAPTGVTMTQSKSSGNPHDINARIRTFVTAQWTNTAVPGQFISVEREDKVQLDPIRLSLAWVELKQIGTSLDPTELIVDVTVEGPELLTKRGNKYRVCAVVPALGVAGKACSEPIIPGTVTPFDVNKLAANGMIVTDQDPLAAELRDQQSGAAGQRGFYIGMAAAEGQTLPGPGKDRIRDSLTPAEQTGFNAAVAFSLERNRNFELAAKGANIARVDPVVSAARNASTDVFYRLGFDIATGIFGDPALGARGNTTTGPGSLGIRDSLSRAGQSGFNDSVRLHLSRTYRP